MLTKTDFLEYLDCPLHLWARLHNRIEKGPSLHDQHLMAQGQEVEGLAQEFLGAHLAGQGELNFQSTFQEGEFLARVDAALYDPEADVIDIYEIKSSTSVKKEHYYDLAFQALVCSATTRVRDTYLVYVNKEYILGQELDLGEFFRIENLNEGVAERLEEVRWEREQALEIVQLDDPSGIPGCHQPNSCPALSLCHGELPAYPIYNLPRLTAKKSQALKERGIRTIREIPADYELTEKQQLHKAAVESSQPLIDRTAIQGELEGLDFPLYFLDYETYPPGLPLYPGYRPYQHVVFQYSLHLLPEPDGELAHHELLTDGSEDPGLELVPHLLERIGDRGSVLVWNQSFEITRNKAMAERYPAYRQALLAVNQRVYDLMDVFRKDYYVHPDFRGSASLKVVLPVMVPEFEEAYANLPISGGDQAMLSWRDLQAGQIAGKEAERVRAELLAYCQLDTLAMVEIWRVLEDLVR